MRVLASEATPDRSRLDDNEKQRSAGETMRAGGPARCPAMVKSTSKSLDADSLALQPTDRPALRRPQADRRRACPGALRKQPIEDT